MTENNFARIIFRSGAARGWVDIVPWMGWEPMGSSGVCGVLWRLFISSGWENEFLPSLAILGGVCGFAKLAELEESGRQWFETGGIFWVLF